MSRRITALVVVAALCSLGWWSRAGSQPAPDATQTRPPAPHSVDVTAVAPLRGRPAAPAIALTASDGSGLRLVAVAADGVLEPPLAFTELRLRFHNPEPRVREGRFRIVLPPGAAISRFAMKVGDRWQEGEVVERQRARRVYEDFLHRRQDPALLEQAAGNEFSARVFPIPAAADKELLVSYSHELPRAGEPWVLPLAGLPSIGELDVRVLVARRESGRPASNLGGQSFDHRVVEVSRRDFAPLEDLRVEPEAGGPAALRHEDLVLARVTVPGSPVPQEIGSLLVLVDSSASRGLAWERQLDVLDRLIAALAAGAGDVPLAVIAFDQEVAPVYEGGARGWSHRAALAARRPLGATDLAGALDWLAMHLARPGSPKYGRVLLLGDGVVTAEARQGTALADAVAALGRLGVERLDALVLGGGRDEATLARLVTAGLPADGVVLDGDRLEAPGGWEELARRFTRQTSSLGVEVAGARWVWPQRLDGVQAGDERLVYADLPAGRPLAVRLGDGEAVPFAPRPTERPLLERAWVAARIARLLALRDGELAADPDLSSAMRAEVIELSLRHRVLSPFTALLVLETEADYRRFDIERRGVSDLLTIGPQGVEVVHRTFAPPPADATSPLHPRSKRVPIPTSDGAENRLVEREDGSEAAILPDPTPGEPEAESLQALADELAAQEGRDEIDSFAVPEPAAPLLVGRQEIPRPTPAPRDDAPPPPARRRVLEEIVVESGAAVEEPPALEGRFATIQRLLAGDSKAARAEAESWAREAPGEVLALVALGHACVATGDPGRAARAYGSLIDLFPDRADLRRYAGELLSALPAGSRPDGLIVDTFRAAVADRPDHPSSHRLLAWALLQAGDPQAAFSALAVGLGRSYPAGRFAGVDRVLREELGLLAAAWERSAPQRQQEIRDRLREAGGVAPEGPSLRFVLSWETDANDVDLHLEDGRGNHADYRTPALPTGGRLYADVTTGYGPECFAIPGDRQRRSGPYRVSAHYYRRGPMGYGMGILQVIEHDGAGDVRLQTRPFVVMADDATVDLGTADEAARRSP